jgi:RNA polymerase sigma-B factor
MSPTQTRRSRGSRERHEERVLFALHAAGDARARCALIERFMPLARSLALRYQRSAEPLDDLLQVASLGLIKAVDGFDTTRDVAFSSYAVPTILGEIKRHFRDRTWAVRVPRDLQELSLKIDRAIGRLAESLHRQPSVAELAAAVGATEEEVLEALQAGGAQRALSFQARRGGTDDDAAELGDTIGIDEDGFGLAEKRATVAALVVMLTPRERDILRMRFEEDMTQAEIGAVIGVSQMQVSRIIRAALARMHTVAAAHMPETV